MATWVASEERRRAKTFLCERSTESTLPFLGSSTLASTGVATESGKSSSSRTRLISARICSAERGSLSRKARKADGASTSSASALLVPVTSCSTTLVAMAALRSSTAVSEMSVCQTSSSAATALAAAASAASRAARRSWRAARRAALAAARSSGVAPSSSRLFFSLLCVLVPRLGGFTEQLRMYRWNLGPPLVSSLRRPQLWQRRLITPSFLPRRTTAMLSSGRVHSLQITTWEMNLRSTASNSATEY
mmetsp:Transcript_15267/g.38855  ORF Transcript_15267/g.38855 Transcript_15267/m.38855 type:complete len:248 (+) Transcript_15267:278-1021(+)